MKVIAITRGRFALLAASATLLVVPGAPCRATEAMEWSLVTTLEPGTLVSVEVEGRQPLRALLGRADPNELVLIVNERFPEETLSQIVTAVSRREDLVVEYDGRVVEKAEYLASFPQAAVVRVKARRNRSGFKGALVGSLAGCYAFASLGTLLDDHRGEGALTWGGLYGGVIGLVGGALAGHRVQARKLETVYERPSEPVAGSTSVHGLTVTSEGWTARR